MASSNPSAERLEAAVSNLVARALANREKTLRWAWVAQLLVAVICLAFAWYGGKDRARLMYGGARTQGTIVAYERTYTRNPQHPSLGHTSYVPVVEFTASDHKVRFRDMMAGMAGPTRAQVTVLYDAANPNIAMIDRGLINWMPWAIPLAIGTVLAIAAFVGFLRGIFGPG